MGKDSFVTRIVNFLGDILIAIFAFFAGSLSVVFYFLWGFGGLVGAILHLIEGNYVDVALCIFIPFYGAFVTIKWIIDIIQLNSVN